MAEIRFTSYVYHGDTVPVPFQYLTVDTRTNDNGETEYVIYLNGVGEFSSDDSKALKDLFTASNTHEPVTEGSTVINDADWINECDGHETLSGAHMGETVYCDGRCKRDVQAAR